MQSKDVIQPVHDDVSAAGQTATAGKMPHERDESPDPAVPPPQPEMEQASRDLSRGLVDTDRGAAVDKTYKKQQVGGS